MAQTKGMEANLSSDKLFRIIEYMAASRLPMRLKNISENLGISQPTVLRYLRTMCDQGYAYHDDNTGYYALTWKICRLGNSLESNLVLRSMAGSLLSEFANIYNVGVLLAVEREGELIYLDLVGAPHGLVDTMIRIGKDAPMHSTGSGKILLSAMPPSRVQQIFERSGQIRLTNNTITKLDELQRELVLVQQRKYALDNEECEEGHRCVSVPLYDYSGRIAAAISAFDSAERLNDEFIRDTVLPALWNMAKEISFRMGYSEKKDTDE
ncbi:MAG: IclR family transcriptional regulator [Oscillospiraceae bacterium]|nr:IclR family transcriptional regulator [Oscillospiraceae bacterium]MBQ9938390.1 IclR family transcriptional regulator [Oscillospiraceae bacterium]